MKTQYDNYLRKKTWIPYRSQFKRIIDESLEELKKIDIFQGMEK